MSKPTLTLNPRPDAFGFLYGELVAGAKVFRVNVMPAAGAWAGDVKLAQHGPHASDWVVYVDGKEIARVRRREDLAGAIAGTLAPPR